MQVLNYDWHFSLVSSAHCIINSGTLLITCWAFFKQIILWIWEYNHLDLPCKAAGKLLRAELGHFCVTYCIASVWVHELKHGGGYSSSPHSTAAEAYLKWFMEKPYIHIHQNMMYIFIHFWSKSIFHLHLKKILFPPSFPFFLSSSHLPGDGCFAPPLVSSLEHHNMRGIL